MLLTEDCGCCQINCIVLTEDLDASHLIRRTRIEILFFWNITCRLVNTYRRFERSKSLHLLGQKIFSWTTWPFKRNRYDPPKLWVTYFTVETSSRAERPESSYRPLLEHQISHKLITPFKSMEQGSSETWGPPRAGGFQGSRQKLHQWPL